MDGRDEVEGLRREEKRDELEKELGGGIKERRVEMRTSDGEGVWLDGCMSYTKRTLFCFAVMACLCYSIKAVTRSTRQFSLPSLPAPLKQ